MTTGDKIAKARKTQNITQEQLADLLGVSRQAVSRWESDLAYPETENLIKLSSLLKVNCDYLLKPDVSEEGAKITEVTVVKELYQKRKVNFRFWLMPAMLFFGFYLAVAGIWNLFLETAELFRTGVIIGSAVCAAAGLFLIAVGLYILIDGIRKKEYFFKKS